MDNGPGETRPPATRSRQGAAFWVVVFEAVLFLAVSGAILAAARDRGSCGPSCSAATPLIVAAAAVSVAALVGLAVMLVQGPRPGRRGDRAVAWLGIGLLVVVPTLLGAVVFLGGTGD
jgi:hypothetical protein